MLKFKIKNLYLICLINITLTNSISAIAQNPDTKITTNINTNAINNNFTGELSLAQIFSLAKSYDNTYLAAFAQKQANIDEVGIAKASLLPQINASAGVNYQYNNPENSSSNSTTSTAASINLRQALYNKSAKINIQQAKQYVSLADLQIYNAQNELALKCAAIYFAILAAQDNIALLEAKQANINLQLQAAKRTFELGTTTITDTHEAQARFDQAAAQLITANNELQIQKQALISLIGKEINIKKIIHIDLNKIQTLAKQTIDIEQNLAIQITSLNYNLANLQLQFAQSLSAPKVDLVSSIGTNRSNNHLQNSTGAAIGVNVNIPLFTGFAYSSQVAQAKNLQYKSSLDKEQAIRNTTFNITQLQKNLASLIAQYHALLSAKQSAELALKSNNLGYKVGVRINIDVLNAQDQVFSASSALNQTKYEILNTLIKLQAQSQILTEQDIDIAKFKLNS